MSYGSGLQSFVCRLTPAAIAYGGVNDNDLEERRVELERERKLAEEDAKFTAASWDRLSTGTALVGVFAPLTSFLFPHDGMTDEVVVQTVFAMIACGGTAFGW